MKKIWAAISSQSFTAGLAVLGFLLAVYLGFFYEKKSELVITVSPATKVLDIYKAVGGLDVSYEGKSLRDSGNTLWVMNTTIRNTGASGVRKVDFDENAPVGVTIENGQIVDTPSFHTNTEYLKNNIKLETSSSSIKINSVIIEAGDYISINFLVLGDETTIPKVSPLGKVAGISKISIVTDMVEDQNTPLLASIFQAENWWIQPIRGFAYTFIFVFSSLAVGGLISAISVPFSSLREKREKNNRQKKADNYKANEPLSFQARTIVKDFIDRGDVSLIELYRLVKVFEQREKLKSQLEETLGSEEAARISTLCHKPKKSEKDTYESMKKIGFPASEEHNREIIEAWKLEIEELAKHLEINLNQRPRYRTTTYESWDSSGELLTEITVHKERIVRNTQQDQLKE